MKTNHLTSKHKPVRGTQLNRSHPLTKDLIGCFLFNEGSGNKCLNLVDNTFYEIDNSPDWSVPGAVGFWSGSTRLCITGLQSKYDDTSINLSVAMSVYPLTAPEEAQHYIFSWNGNYVITWGHSNANYRNTMTIGTAWPTNPTFSATGAEWKDLVMSFDNNANTIYGYENGIALTTGSASSIIDGNTGSYIGSSSTDNSEFNGYIRYCYIWNRAVNREEAQLLHREPYAMFEQPTKILPILTYGSTNPVNGNIFTHDDDVVAVYNFENNANDSKGSADLTGVNTPTYDSNDYKQGSYSADFEHNSGEYFYCNDGDLPSNFPGKSGQSDSDFSVTAWIKAESWPDTYGRIIIKYDHTSNERSWNLHYYTDGDLKIFLGHNGGASYEEICRTSNTLSTGVWYFIHMTHTASTKGWTLRTWNANTSSWTNEESDTATNAMSPDSAAFQIGGFTDRYFDGKIDEVVIWDRVLSNDDAADVRDGIYNYPASLSLSDTVSAGSVVDSMAVNRLRQLAFAAIQSASGVDSFNSTRTRALELSNLLSSTAVDSYTINRLRQILLQDISSRPLLSYVGSNLFTGTFGNYGAVETNEAVDEHDGRTNCQHVIDDPAGYDGCSTNTFSVNKYGVYEVHFWLKVISLDVSVKWRYGDQSGSDNVFKNLSPAAWTEYTGRFVEPVGGAVAYMYVICDEGSGSGEFYLSDFSVRHVNDMKPEDILRNRSLALTDVAAASQVDDALVETFLKILNLINVTCSTAAGPVSLDRMRHLVLSAVESQFKFDNVSLQRQRLVAFAKVLASSSVDTDIDRIRKLVVSEVASISAVNNPALDRLRQLVISNIQSATDVGTITMNVVTLVKVLDIISATSVDSTSLTRLRLLALASVLSQTEFDGVTLTRIRQLAVAAVESMTNVDDPAIKRLRKLLVADIKAATSLAAIVKYAIDGILTIIANEKTYSITADKRDFDIVANTKDFSIEANEKDFTITAN